jgi:hypothetical protein
MAAPPSSPVDICNLALFAMGEPSTVTSIITPQTQIEEKMALTYDAVRQGLLREFFWLFAQANATLASNGPGFGPWLYAYPFPVDCLRVNNLGWTMEHPHENYEIQGRTIYTSWLMSGSYTTPPGTAPPLMIRYTCDAVNVRLFDALFVLLLSLRLAYRTAYSITKKRSVEEKIEKQMEIEEPKAISVNSQEQKIIRVQHSNLMAMRRYGGQGMVYGAPWYNFE